MTTNAVDAKWLRHWQLHESRSGEGLSDTGVFICPLSLLAEEAGRNFATHKTWELLVIDPGARWPRVLTVVDDVAQHARRSVILADAHDQVPEGWSILMSWDDVRVPGRVDVELTVIDLTTEERELERFLQNLAAQSSRGLRARFLAERWLRLFSSSLFALDTSVRRQSSIITNDLRPAPSLEEGEDQELDPENLDALVSLLDDISVDSRVAMATQLITYAHRQGAQLVLTEYTETARGLAWVPDIAALDPLVLTGESAPAKRSRVVEDAVRSGRPLIATTTTLQGLELSGFSRALHVDVPSPKRLWVRFSHARGTGASVEHVVLVTREQLESHSGLAGTHDLGSLRIELLRRS